MKQKILRCINFILILVIILIILSYIAIPKRNLEKYGMENQIANGILGEKENTIDVLIVGNSESYTSVVPLKIWGDYGYTTYICGTSGQTLPDSCMFVYRAMKSQNPKIVILEADNLFDREKLSKPFTKVIEEMVPIIKYHDRWKNLNKEDFFKDVEYNWSDDFKGYNYTTTANEAEDKNYVSKSKSDNANRMPKSNQLYVKMLNEFCKRNNAQLIIVSTPSPVNWTHKNHNGIKKFAEKENIEFLDLNMLNDEIKIDWEKDTRDKGDHLNHHGAVKVTEYMGKYLSSKNVLEDHRQDERYSKWNEIYNNYKVKYEQK